MAYTREELMPLLQEREQQQEAQRQFRLQSVKAAGENVSELQADPRWEKFFRPIEAQSENLKHGLVAIERKLTGDYLPSEEYANAKIAQARVQGQIAGFDYVIGLAKTLIEAGNKAKEELEKQ